MLENILLAKKKTSIRNYSKRIITFWKEKILRDTSNHRFVNQAKHILYEDWILHFEPWPVQKKTEGEEGINEHNQP